MRSPNLSKHIQYHNILALHASPRTMLAMFSHFQPLGRTSRTLETRLPTIFFGVKTIYIWTMILRLASNARPTYRRTCPVKNCFQARCKYVNVYADSGIIKGLSRRQSSKSWPSQMQTLREIAASSLASNFRRIFDIHKGDRILSNERLV